jgi:hypothetical protein
MGVCGQREAPAALLPAKSPGTCCGGGWVGPSTGVDEYSEKKIFFPKRGGGGGFARSESQNRLSYGGQNVKT